MGYFKYPLKLLQTIFFLSFKSWFGKKGKRPLQGKLNSRERSRVSWHLGEPHGFLITHQDCDRRRRRKHGSTHLEERGPTECVTRLQSDKNLKDDITRPSPGFPNSATVCIPEADGNPSLQHIP